MSPPSLNPDQQNQLQLTSELIASELEQAGGSLPFDRFMELALYAPGAGYYVNGTRKFGASGDFVTAPEISSLFSRCLANQCAQVLGQLNGGDILEFGAGSGVMAADMLARLQELDCLPIQSSRRPPFRWSGGQREQSCRLSGCCDSCRKRGDPRFGWLHGRSH